MNVELKEINKTFGIVQANVGINLKIPAGTIQGILGENGAGKSTLMKILSGFIRADSGEVLLDSQVTTIHSPADAIRHGIGMLHQDPLDFPPMRVIDNFILGHSGDLFPNLKKSLSEFNNLAEQFGFTLSPDAYIDTLTVGERQQLEILRLLWLGARVLIFDEPTTGISAIQKQKLFSALKHLAKQGKTIIFVSHKLEDVQSLCNQVAVLRQGVLVGEAKPPYTTRKLVEMMFGKTISAGGRSSCSKQVISFRLKNFSVEDYRIKIKNVDLDLHRGEVIGLAGMEGSGQGLFLRAASGLVRAVGGKVLLNGKNLTGRSYLSFKRNGVGFLPAARLEDGLVPGLTLTEHFALAGEKSGYFINWNESRETAQARINDYNVRGMPSSTIESLSGGNQQRALLALLGSPLALLFMEHPTRGLDIESTIYIWSKLKERCSQGTSIIFISSDLEEILQHSDRVLVFFSGQVSHPLESKKLNTDLLGELIGGVGWNEFTSGKTA
jgi:general nucleoside transport system ATP-binding protein